MGINVGCNCTYWLKSARETLTPGERSVSIVYSPVVSVLPTSLVRRFYDRLKRDQLAHGNARYSGFDEHIF